ncbi:Cob(I)alamin adenosyltransferase [Mucinivorans hirudinis]|uniref:corrinoid adenosyltransferase n=1 Tax=Mucinivorans hirudinis TaxID=1433126 RepID=A0A060RA27_9BACT|nr:Cob(I)alamin adenosyltransferase [Mucinivorans hirudinis]
MKGYLHVYTGDGKGKTTSALGLALRSAGSGKRVFFAQFIKGQLYSEIKALERYSDLVVTRQFGLGCLLFSEPVAEDIEAAREGLRETERAMLSGDYQLVVFDEANIALRYKFFTLDELMEVINRRPPGVEVVVTGRDAPPQLIEAADLVTHMQQVKHYYQSGVSARLGIEY